MLQQSYNIPDWNILLSHAFPWLLPLVVACVLLIVPFFLKRYAHDFSFAACGLALLSSLVSAWSLWWKAGGVENGMFLFDRFTYLLMVFLALAGLLVTLLSYSYLQTAKLFQPEFYALILFSLFGMGCMVAGSDLIVVFLGLETMSIALYVLAGFWRANLGSVEAALKYFLLGAFASGFLIMGIAFLFGASHTTHLPTIYQMGYQLFQGPDSFYTYLAVSLIAVGFAFKLAVVPFHFWAADVYEGAPVVVTTWMATAVKVAAFGALIRVVWALMQWESQTLGWLVWTGSVLTMTVGNVAALLQKNLKRMLAYSSIAHAGYILIPLAAFEWEGIAVTGSISFYLLAYVLMTIGAFAVLAALTGEEREQTDITFLGGLSRRQPFLAFCMTLFLISLAGIPPTVGFFAKYFLFSQAVKAGFLWLVVIAVLNSVISVYYYLRPVVAMYFGAEKEEGLLPVSLSTPALATILLCLLGVISFGLFPDTLLQFVQESSRLALHP